MIIEAIVIKYLSDALNVPVYAEEPEKKELPYVVLEQTSGTKTNHIVSASIAFDSYADTRLEALKLNNKVIEAMDLFPLVKNVSRSTLNSTYNASDTTSKRYCYQCLFDVTYIPTEN